PECQPLMMRLDGDLAAILDACAGGTLAGVADTIRWHDGTALCVVMAAKGYPGAYQKGSVIDLAEAAAAAAETVIFHAGTATDSNGRLVSAGGRVLGVTAQASTVREARDRAYAVVDAMNWPEGFCRRDIAWRALERGNP
ncbi:MAG: phosphoribosylamine--glycine ligase, partial [Alphaproteobacteria bacterium]|nr:phosphoribosylamine--glycine ligase [Alphaproteobacteria bacterium]